MLNLLRSIFQPKPRAQKLVDLEARLSPTSGYTCSGDLECEAWDNGNWEIEIEVDHNGPAPEGPWRVLVDAREITTTTPSTHHETEVKLRNGQHNLEFAVEAGMQVEIHGPTGLMLSGTLQPDR